MRDGVVFYGRVPYWKEKVRKSTLSFILLKVVPRDARLFGHCKSQHDALYKNELCSADLVKLRKSRWMAVFLEWFRMFIK